MNRSEQLREYLKRLNQGEALESVSADFVAHFKEVDASEILEAEQQLMAQGVPITEVQKLCDIHSALFHGATRQERIAKAEQALAESLQQKAATYPQADYSNKKERAAALMQQAGHPLHTLSMENRVLKGLLEAAMEKLEGGEDIEKELAEIHQLAIHYAKKGDLLYPHLKVKYGIAGPSDVMWTVDDEIRDELTALIKQPQHDAQWTERMKKVLQRADEMIYKEENIFFPTCAVNFTEEEWKQIYRDSKDYADCLGVSGDIWESAEQESAAAKPPAEGEICLSGGHMSLEQLTALLNTIPLEISFIDENNINCYFNEGPKVFKRPAMAIDREVFSCHPPKIEAMVRSIIEDFRSGRRDSVPVWMEKGGRTMLVKYMAVRDSRHKYLGTVELVQDMEDIKNHFLSR